MRLVSKVAGGGRRKGLTINGSLDTMPLWSVNARADREQIENDFVGYVQQAYKDNGVVYACMLARECLFSEARFQWQQMRLGRPGKLFGNSELDLLETPWPNGTTGELLTRMIQDADLAGNFFATTADDQGRLGRAASGQGRRLVRMRPDWVKIVLGSKSGRAHALDTKPIAYVYEPPGADGLPKPDPTILLPNETVHFSPRPDPEAHFRGMSWLTPVLREVMADKSASKHKLKFFEHGATLGTIVTLDKDVDEDAFDEFVERFREQHEGVDVAYKTLVIGGGATPTTVGANMQQLDFKNTQGAGETRIAAAAGMHPVIVGLSEGLAGSSLNAGNFDSAIQLTTNKTIRPLWRQASAALGSIITKPAPSTRLWYDVRDVAFLQDDESSRSEIRSKDASTAKQLIDAGYEPDSVTDYLATDDVTVLKHTGRPTVQVQAAAGGMATTPAAGAAPVEGE